MILALDTSLHDLRIGLYSDDAKPLAAFDHHPDPHERGVHDSLLAAKTNELLRKVNAKPAEIRRIVYIAGPGSFTGLRIGLAFAKGLAYAVGASLVPVPTHAALAASLKQRREGLLLAYPGYDKHSLYIASASRTDDIALVPVRELLPELAISGPEQALELLASKHEHTSVCSIDLDAVVRYALAFPELIHFDELSALEPLYITPFIPHPASKK